MATETHSRRLPRFFQYHTGLERNTTGVYRIEVWIPYPRFRHPYQNHSISFKPSYSSQLDYVLKEFQRYLRFYYYYANINLNDYNIYYRFLYNAPGSRTSTGMQLALTDLTLFKLIISLRRFLPRDQFLRFQVLDRY